MKVFEETQASHSYSLNRKILNALVDLTKEPLY